MSQDAQDVRSASRGKRLGLASDASVLTLIQLSDSLDEQIYLCDDWDGCSRLFCAHILRAWLSLDGKCIFGERHDDMLQSTAMNASVSRESCRLGSQRVLHLARASMMTDVGMSDE